MAYFLVTTTADFDGGTKSDVETITNNALQTANQVGLAPTFCDRWAGGARQAGWTEENDTGADCVDETNQLKVTAQEHEYSHLQRSPAVDNITIQGKLIFPASSFENSWATGIAMYWDVDNWIRAQIVHDSGTIKHCWNLNNASTPTYGFTGSLSTGVWYWYKIILTATTYEVLYSTNGTAWTSHTSGSRPGGWSGAPSIMVGKGYMDNPTYTAADWDNSYAPAGTSYDHYAGDIVVLPYKTSGNWLSVTITPHNYEKLYSLTVSLSGGDGSNYIDKVEIIKSSDSSVLSTYNTNMSSTTTLYSADFDNGFNPTANVPFKVKLYFVGGGTTTVQVTELSGEMQLGIVGYTYDRFVNQGGF